MTAIAVILLGAGIGYSVQRAGKTESISLEEMQNSVSSALKGEMESAATSLEQLNQNIADNQKKLDEVNAQLAQREESLLQVETIQHRLEENASGMTGKVTDLEVSIQMSQRRWKKFPESCRKWMPRKNRTIPITKNL